MDLMYVTGSPVLDTADLALSRLMESPAVSRASVWEDSEYLCWYTLIHAFHYEVGDDVIYSFTSAEADPGH